MPNSWPSRPVADNGVHAAQVFCIGLRAKDQLLGSYSLDLIDNSDQAVGILIRFIMEAIR